jgi:hypothetical protein
MRPGPSAQSGTARRAWPQHPNPHFNFFLPLPHSQVQFEWVYLSHARRHFRTKGVEMHQHSHRQRDWQPG